MTLEHPRLLPMADHVRGKRSAVTCQLKCANACLGDECNTSSNPSFRDIASVALSRRALLGLGTAGALALIVGDAATDAPAAQAAGAAPAVPAGAGLSFGPIAPVDKAVDAFVVPEGFSWSPIIRWGDPLFADSPAFDIHSQTAAAQERQFGYNNDYLAIVPDASGTSGVLVCNHEYVNPNIMFPASSDPAVLEDRANLYKAAQGMTVVELTRPAVGQPWSYVQGGARNRRLTVETEFELTGRAAGSTLLKTIDDPSGRIVRGTLGNCAGGLTPWGTILSGEENFNGYFTAPTVSAERKRYGLAALTTSTTWERYDPRFNADNPGYENEPNRFGYIVEIDPQNPTAMPLKHTAMGRFKHEGANVIVGDDGKVVAYMGDDERNDYLYKFVSKHKYNPKNNPGARKQNRRLLSDGDLYVAKFTGNSAAEIDGSGRLPSDGLFDGTGEWVALTHKGESAVPGMTTEQVLVYTRLAADLAGATKMDRCEDVEPSLATGKVYIACTNNSDRGKAGKNAPADEANPRNGNRDGHVIELTEVSGQGGTRFAWNILLLCGNPATDSTTYFAGYPKEQVSPISCPDNVAFDSEGNLWISTDGAPSKIGTNDGLFKVPLEGPERGRVQQFLSVPRDAETCGPVIHDQDGLVFVAVQHPGEEGAWEAPHSLFPDYVDADGGGKFRAPRPAVVQSWRSSAL
ncbi:PhoX family protein [Luethyella okanaganae]|uniref:PhoX family protein n=1 Tax=Luethyella okanaganae TaxID=69372 RepID=A0ABW1VIM6_9MICO